MARVSATLKAAKRDGPLLNFCRLIYIGMLAVPFKGSGLRETDFKKLLDLMQKMSDDSPLPLGHASTSVWEELCQLRDEVADICKKIKNEDQVVGASYRSDGASMMALLDKIDRVHCRHPSSTHEHLPIQGVDSRGKVFP